ncbi:hypothetical protein [Arcticibacter sp. MXS-1]|uniref:hypothetical protein n=1 Tax=Arcticibacter sp. MXS-1 TaxID=3341726 RepID=UPI0035A8EAC4
MITKNNYRNQLIETLKELKYTWQRLLAFGVNLEMFDEENEKDVFPAQRSESAVDVILLINSDSPAVKRLYSCMTEIEACFDSLMNLNGISERQFESWYSYEKHAPEDLFLSRQPKEYYKWLNEAYSFLEMQMYYLLNYCYCMVYDEPDVPESICRFLLFPGKEALDLLKTSDTNVNKIIELCFALNRTCADIDSMSINLLKESKMGQKW